MKKHLLVGTVAALLISVSAIPALAFDNTGSKQSSMFGDLNLTAAQKQKITAIRKEMRNDPQRIELRAKLKELRTLKGQKPVDQAKVDAKIKEIQDLRAQSKTKNKPMFDQFKTILTPAQLEKLKADFKNRPTGKEHFAGKHGSGDFHGRYDHSMFK